MYCLYTVLSPPSHSVTVTRRDPVSPPSMQGSAESMQGSAESMQGSAESMQSTKNLQSSSLSMQGYTDISTMDAHSSMESMKNSGQDIQGSTESMAVSADDSILESAKSMQESTESIQENPKYILIRVNRYRDSIPGEEPLEDHGKFYHPLFLYWESFKRLKIFGSSPQK